MVTAEHLVRPAISTDQQHISNLIHFEPYIHRHLDWRSPLDWLGSPYFWVAEHNHQIVAAFACPPDPEGVAWIRLFASADVVPLRESWLGMWSIARAELAGSGWKVAAIALQDWLRVLLEASGFVHYQDIVMLELDVDTTPCESVALTYQPREMVTQDLQQVAEVDALAFDPIWRNSLLTLNKALPLAGLATVVEVGSKIVGYQISTQNPFGAHLARLAVHPDVQHKGIGRSLVVHLAAEVMKRGLRRITVNTQSDNRASLALYANLGFTRTREEYPVYIYSL
jgi:ribosomal protein S18 acetylase RimI-like enzyme